MNNEVNLNYYVDNVILTPRPEAFGLQGPEAYAYTSLSNCLSVSDIDDSKDYSDTIVRDASKRFVDSSSYLSYF